MPSISSISNRHLKSLSASWLAVGYCELLNGQPSFPNGSMLGVNANVVSQQAHIGAPQQQQQHRSTVGSEEAVVEDGNGDGNTDVAFVYGGIFDSQSVSIEKPPLPPHMAKIVAGATVGGHFDTSYNEERTERSSPSSSSPPPPPAWRCAKDTAARMDAYLSNHRTDLASQQIWLRDLNKLTQRRQRVGEGEDEERRASTTAAEALLLDSPHYGDLMRVQLEAKRQRRSLEAERDRGRRHSLNAQQEQQRAAIMALRERERLAEMARGGTVLASSSHKRSSLPQHPSSSSASAMSSSSSSSSFVATATNNSSSSLLSVAEAQQYLSLADREFLLSIRNTFVHCDRLLKDSQTTALALEAEAAKTGGDGTSTDHEMRLAKAYAAGLWAKRQLRNIASDGTCALWFTASQRRGGGGGGGLAHQRTLLDDSSNNNTSSPPSEAAGKEEGRGGASAIATTAVSMSVYNTGNSRAVCIRSELIAAYLTANGIDLDAIVRAHEKSQTIDGQRPETVSHPWLWSTHQRRRAAEEYEKKMNRAFVYTSELPAHHQANPQRLHKERMAQMASGDTQWLSEDSGAAAESTLGHNRLPEALFAPRTSGGSAVASPTSTLTGRGSLMSFSQAFRLRNIKGLCLDHSPTNAMERRRCNLSAQGRNLNTLHEAVSCAVVDENFIVSDGFDVGAYLADAASPSLSASSAAASPSVAPSGKCTPSHTVDVPLLTLRPPSLVTRALGMVRYKMGSSQGPREQIMVPFPDEEGASSVGGAAANVSLEAGEVVLFCSRSVFESEASSDFTYAADGSTVDDIVEAVLQGIMAQVVANIAKLDTLTLLKSDAPTTDGQSTTTASATSTVDTVAMRYRTERLLSALTRVDAQSLASEVCSVALDCGTRKSLQAMVAVVPACPSVDDHGDAAEASSSCCPTLHAEEEPPLLTSGGPSFVISISRPAPSVTLTTSLVPSPIFVAPLRSDALYRTVFCEDLARSKVSLTTYLRMRFALLKRTLLGGGGHSSAVVPAVMAASAASTSNVGATNLKTTNAVLNQCYPTLGGQMRRTLRSEAFIFGEGPPPTCSATSGSGGGEDVAAREREVSYYRSIARDLFGRERANREA